MPSNVASRGDMGFICTHSKQLLESFRLLLRIRSFNDNRYAVKIHEVSLNFAKVMGLNCITKSLRF